MKLLRIVAAFAATPWALEFTTLEALAEIIARGARGEKLGDDEIRAAIESKSERAPYTAVGAKENVAVIPIHGVIGHRASLVADTSSGVGTSCELVEQVIRAAAADPSIRSIVLDINSPGGSVFGVHELADTIAEARASKPIAAVANSTACSAAYWIASAAHEIFMIPSGEIGSIGVFGTHVDVSKAEELQGKKTTLISAGKFKTEGAGPLSDDARAHMQSRIDAYYTQFVKSVAKNRNVAVDAVRNGYGEGRVVGAQAALAAGMVDGIATLSEVIQKYARRTPEAANRSRALADAQIRIAQAGSGPKTA